MRKSKHPVVVPDPDRHRQRTDKRTWQLGRVVWADSSSDWTAIHVATRIARERGGEVYTGYFDPKSDIVKKSIEQGARI